MKLHSLLDNLAVVIEEEEEEEGEEEEEDVWERNPSISEMFQNGVPTDYLVIVFLTFLICISVLGRHVLFRIFYVLYSYDIFYNSKSAILGPQH